jgi:hypothetical protein
MLAALQGHRGVKKHQKCRAFGIKAYGRIFGPLIGKPRRHTSLELIEGQGTRARSQEQCPEQEERLARCPVKSSCAQGHRLPVGWASYRMG